jgi:hypothetical protein
MRGFQYRDELLQQLVSGFEIGFSIGICALRKPSSAWLSSISGLPEGLEKIPLVFSFMGGETEADLD